MSKIGLQDNVGQSDSSVSAAQRGATPNGRGASWSDSTSAGTAAQQFSSALYQTKKWTTSQVGADVARQGEMARRREESREKTQDQKNLVLYGTRRSPRAGRSTGLATKGGLSGGLAAAIAQSTMKGSETLAETMPRSGAKTGEKSDRLTGLDVSSDRASPLSDDVPDLDTAEGSDLFLDASMLEFDFEADPLLDLDLSMEEPEPQDGETTVRSRVGGGARVSENQSEASSDASVMDLLEAVADSVLDGHVDDQLDVQDDSGGEGGGGDHEGDECEGSEEHGRGAFGLSDAESEAMARDPMAQKLLASTEWNSAEMDVSEADPTEDEMEDTEDSASSEASGNNILGRKFKRVERKPPSPAFQALFGKVARNINQSAKSAGHASAHGRRGEVLDDEDGGRRSDRQDQNASSELSKLTDAPTAAEMDALAQAMLRHTMSQQNASSGSAGGKTKEGSPEGSTNETRGANADGAESMPVKPNRRFSKSSEGDVFDLFKKSVRGTSSSTFNASTRAGASSELSMPSQLVSAYTTPSQNTLLPEPLLPEPFAPLQAEQALQQEQEEQGSIPDHPDTAPAEQGEQNESEGLDSQSFDPIDGEGEGAEEMPFQESGSYVRSRVGGGARVNEDQAESTTEMTASELLEALASTSLEGQADDQLNVQDGSDGESGGDESECEVDHMLPTDVNSKESDTADPFAKKGTPVRRYSYGDGGGRVRTGLPAAHHVVDVHAVVKAPVVGDASGTASSGDAASNETDSESEETDFSKNTRKNTGLSMGRRAFTRDQVEGSFQIDRALSGAIGSLTDEDAGALSCTEPETAPEEIPLEETPSESKATQDIEVNKGPQLGEVTVGSIGSFTNKTQANRNAMLGSRASRAHSITVTEKAITKKAARVADSVLSSPRGFERSVMKGSIRVEPSPLPTKPIFNRATENKSNSGGKIDRASTNAIAKGPKLGEVTVGRFGAADMESTIADVMTAENIAEIAAEMISTDTDWDDTDHFESERVSDADAEEMGSATQQKKHDGGGSKGTGFVSSTERIEGRNQVERALTGMVGSVMGADTPLSDEALDGALSDEALAGELPMDDCSEVDSTIQQKVDAQQNEDVLETPPPCAEKREESQSGEQSEESQQWENLLSDEPVLINSKKPFDLSALGKSPYMVIADASRNASSSCRYLNGGLPYYVYLVRRCTGEASHDASPMSVKNAVDLDQVLHQHQEHQEHQDQVATAGDEPVLTASTSAGFDSAIAPMPMSTQSPRPNVKSKATRHTPVINALQAAANRARLMGDRPSMGAPTPGVVANGSVGNSLGNDALADGDSTLSPEMKHLMASQKKRTTRSERDEPFGSDQDDEASEETTSERDSGTVLTHPQAHPQPQPQPSADQAVTDHFADFGEVGAKPDSLAESESEPEPESESESERDATTPGFDEIVEGETFAFQINETGDTDGTSALDALHEELNPLKQASQSEQAIVWSVTLKRFTIKKPLAKAEQIHPILCKKGLRFG
ncbi:MAG: hypothetical protein P8176_12670 [Gammaproteobacteria bacterium]